MSTIDTQSDVSELPESLQTAQVATVTDKASGDVWKRYRRLRGEVRRRVENGELETPAGRAEFLRWLRSQQRELLLANVRGETAGDSAGDGISWEDLVSARTTLRNDDYTPTHLIHEPMGTESLLLDERISNRSVGMSDSAIRTGNLPSILGLETIEVTTGLGPYEAVMVDRSEYGYEATEDLMDTIESYPMREKDGTAYKLREFKGWKVMDGNGAAKIEG